MDLDDEMKHQQCEWCEAIATRVFITHNEGYRRFSCGKSEHAERVRRLMSNDGVTEWTEKTPEMPFMTHKIKESSEDNLMEIEQTKEVVTKTSIFISTNGEVGKNLRELYGKIWCEACYDSYDESTKKFASELLPHIQALNRILKFKQ